MFKIKSIKLKYTIKKIIILNYHLKIKKNEEKFEE